MEDAAEEARDRLTVVADQLDGHEQDQRALDDIDQIKRHAQTGLCGQSAVAQGAEDNGEQQNAHRVAARKDADEEAVPADAGVGGEAADEVIVDAEDFRRARDAGQRAANHEDHDDLAADVHTDGVGEFPLLADAVDLIAELGLFQDEVQHEPDGKRDEKCGRAAVLAVQLGKARGLLDEFRVRISVARAEVALGQEARDLRCDAVEHDGRDDFVHAQLRLEKAGDEGIECAEGRSDEQAQRHVQHRRQALDHVARQRRGEGAEEHLALNAHVVHIRADGKRRGYAGNDDRRGIAERIEDAAKGEKGFLMI